MYVLDTNVISELRKAKSGKANHQVITWATGVSVQSMFLSVITILELELGVLQMERRDPIQGSLLRHWLDHQVLPTFSTRVLHVDLQVARSCAAMHRPNPRPERDALIAATALTHSMTVVTRNVSDFNDSGVDVLNPWSV